MNYSVIKKIALFFLLLSPAILLSWQSIIDLYNYSSNSVSQSYIIIIPFLSIFLIFINKKIIFKNQEYNSKNRGVFFVIILTITIIIILNNIKILISYDNNAHTSITIFLLILFFYSEFILFFGLNSIRNCLLPFLILLFLIPIPEKIQDYIVIFFRNGSTEIADFFFTLTGMEYSRDKFLFYFPQITIEVAKECSGINSGLSLIITSLVTGHIFLKSNLNRTILFLSAIPITIFKNGLRVLFLTSYGIYVNKDIFYGNFHKQGGKPFFIIALILLFAVLLILKKIETTRLKSVKKSDKK